MKLKIALGLAFVFILGYILFAPPSDYEEPVVISAAGATFPYPVYSKWAIDYEDFSGVQVNYNATGSGAGIRQVQEGVVDFGGTDAPLTEEQLQEHNLMQFPTVMGAVVPIVNLPVDINVSGEVLAKIFQTDITKWNDPEIAELNPNVDLPDLDIAIIHRAEGSGTTFVWLSYLFKYGSTLGVNTIIDWPAGIGAKGNQGVALGVEQLPGSIGYVEYSYAKQSGGQIASIDGLYPTYESFVNMEWPILAATYILVPNDSPKKDEIMKFFEWAALFGVDAARELDYISVIE